jgi:hypothetical protein
MDTADQAETPQVTIRSLEPADAAEASALAGAPGTFEGTLQLPDMPIASRLEFLQKTSRTAAASSPSRRSASWVRPACTRQGPAFAACMSACSGSGSQPSGRDAAWAGC